MRVFEVTSAVLLMEPLVGLALVGFGLAMFRRRSEPGLMLVIAWGALWVLTGLLNGLVQLSVRSASVTTLQSAFALSGLLAIGGRLLVWGTAGYALRWY